MEQQQQVTTPKYNESIPHNLINIPDSTPEVIENNEDNQLHSFRPRHGADEESSTEHHNTNPKEIDIQFKPKHDEPTYNNPNQAHNIFQSKISIQTGASRTQGQNRLDNEDDHPERYTGFEKVEDSVLLSPTKSILKRGSINQGELSPDRKKKGVAFSLKTNQTENFLDNLDVSMEKQLDDSFTMARQRSKSNDYERMKGASPLEKSNVPRNIVTRNVSVGKVQDGVAILLSEDFCIMEMPLSMLPPDIRKGNILKFSIERNLVEEESRKENIVRVQKELLMDKNLFDEYNKKLEHFKNKKMAVLQANEKKSINLQKVIDDVHVNLQDASFLDRSGFIDDDDRVIIRPKNIAEAKLEKNEAATKTGGLRK